jgi:hypothetical protein
VLHLPTSQEIRRYGKSRRNLPPIAGAGDFRLVDGMASETAGAYEAHSTGISVSWGAVNTKGSWVQLKAATTRDATGIYVFASTNYGTALVDIGVGASGSEQVLIPNLLVPGSPSPITAYFFPISIPAGMCLSARTQGAYSGAYNSYVSAILVGEGLGSPSALSRVTAYGTVSTGSQGTQLSGTTPADTKSAWTTVTTSTTNPCSMLVTAIVETGAYSRLVDFGIGASGSEQLIAGDIPCYAAGLVTLLLPCSLPAGTRIAGRFGSTDTYDQIYVAAYGID